MDSMNRRATDKKRIGIISDTHGLLRPEVMEILCTCDVVLHGGDMNKQEILDKLNEIAPVCVVRGNNDKVWAEYLQTELEIELYGIRFYMVHNKKDMRNDLNGINVVVYGHSHKYEEKQEDGRLYLNPGSCGPRRFRQPVTMAVLEVDCGTKRYQLKRVDLMQQLQAEDDIMMESLPVSERDEQNGSQFSV